MKEKVARFLSRSGYQRLYAPIPGLVVYFTVENGYINAIVLVDAEGEVTDLDAFLSQADWKSEKGEIIDVHSLVVIFSQNPERARQLGQNQRACWYVDTVQERLIVDEGKSEDFYGMRTKLEQVLTQPEEEGAEDVQEEQPQPQIQRKEKRKIPSLINYVFLFLNVVTYILCIFIGDALYDKGMRDTEMILQYGQWYRLVTSMFLHSDLSHLTGNMMHLYLFGDLIEHELKHIKYFILYIGSGVIAGVFAMAVSISTGHFVPALGASGAVFGITGALLWIIIRNRGVYRNITVPKMMFLIAYSLYNGFVGTNIDNAAHIGGLISGFFLAALLYRKKKQTTEKLSKEK